MGTSLAAGVLLSATVSCGGDGGGTGPSGGGSSGGSGNEALAGASSTGSGGAGLPDFNDIVDLGPTDVSLACDPASQLAEAPLLKLSTVQYRNTVRDLLARLGLADLQAGVEPLLLAIPDDSLGDSFRGLDERVAIEHVQGFFNVGVYVGDAVREDQALLAAIAGNCATESQLIAACWDAFLSNLVRLAHRRPLLESERDLYDELNDGAGSPADAVRAAVIVVLSSPRFLYQLETEGADVAGRADLLELDAYAVASRLSYTFWQTMPDEELFARAADGTLLDTATYEQQLERVWQDARTPETMQQFWNEWLRLEKFTGFETSRPAFKALTSGEHFGEAGHEHYRDMTEEVFDLTRLVTFEQPGTLEDLLTTTVSVTRSADLASLYGVEAWDGAGPYPNLTNRAGLLQRAALLVSNLEQTNPFHRGALVRRAILCGDLPQPSPNDLPPGSLDPPPVDEAQTTRERFSAKVEGNNLCAGCHNTFSNLGYVMESFDAVGRFRTTEQVFDEKTGDLLAELPIDTNVSVNLVGPSETVAGPSELNVALVASGQVERCLAERYFSYATRRAMMSSSLDACVVDDLAEVLSSKEGGLAAAFRRMAELPVFFTKKVGAL